MALISVTRLRLRSWRYLLPFVIWSQRAIQQVKVAPGNHGHKVFKDAGLVFWTCTSWENEASMRAYMLGGAHRQAMPKLMNWCDEAATAHYTQESVALPTWAEAHRRLVAGGRRSKVHNPSPAHEAFDIPTPRG
jgi:hypothetical protein